MFTKINVFDIIKSHFKTLRNANSNSLEFDDIIIFIISPVIVGGLFLYFNILLEKDSINLIVTIFSILTGLLINVLVLLFDIIKREKNKELKNQILKEIVSNISYSILISILTIAISFTSLSNIESVCKIGNFITYTLLFNFFVTFLMILKRIYKVFSNEIDESE